MRARKPDKELNKKSRQARGRQKEPAAQEASAATRAYVLCPNWRSKAGQVDIPSRSPEARCAEAVGLAGAIGLDIAGSAIVTIARPQPATLFGKGRLEDIKLAVTTGEVALVIIDGPLTPVQQRNLERAWDCKVLDRTGLILEIFGQRARTKEGRLQVELAHLMYQKSRLVRSWTHLERQRGGFGFLGGPGETQIEADRRQIQDRIRALESQLGKVRRTRELHRAGRRRVPYKVVALVGYTNAGKSTLFNRLTEANVLAEDLLFATLDPTLRAITLPGGGTIIMSDTVGFISNLPTDLVAAFRATLEEVIEADLVLHVRDISVPDSQAEADDVAKVLESLGIDAHSERVMEVWNKIDLLDDDTRAAMNSQAARAGHVAVSAVTGEAVDQLLRQIEARLTNDSFSFDAVAAPDRGRDVNWLYENCTVTSRIPLKDGGQRLTGHAPTAKAGEFKRRFPASKVVETRSSQDPVKPAGR